MRRSTSTPILTFVLLFVLVAGCNVYEGLYEEGESDSPDVLLQDARIALQQDRPEEAVDHLRKALTFTPADDPRLRKQIQIKLASAVLQVQAINALNLERIADIMSRSTSSGATFAHGKASGQTCLFPQSHVREAFDPTAGIDIEHLGSQISQEALSESEDLITRVLYEIEKSSTPTFQCDDAELDQGIAELKAKGLTDIEIAEALMDFTVANTTTTYLDIISAGGGDASFFYVTPPAGDDYIGICFTSAPTCTSTVAQTTADLTELDCSTRVIEKRALLLGSTSAQELAAQAREGYVNMALGLENASCIEY